MHHLITFCFILILVGSTASAAHPDVVLLMTDQHRFDELSLLGTPGADTPAIDQICQSGMMFTHAFVPTPQCSPARAAIMTGRHPHRTGVVGNVSRNRNVPAGMSAPLDATVPSLGALFSKAGYHTAYFGKWHLGKSPAEHGFQTVGVASGREISLRVADFIRELKRQEDRPPVLLIVSWINPHDIYFIDRKNTIVDTEIEAILPKSLDDDLLTKPFPQRHFLAMDQGKPFQSYTKPQWTRYAQYYHQLTTQVDAEVGRVMNSVRGQFPDALTVFTSDHGDLGGAHQMPYKCPAMYDELIRVPLAISWRQQIKPGKSDALVSSIDILPTLCDLAEVPIPVTVDGRSVRPLLNGKSPVESSWRETVFGEYYGKQKWRAPMRMVRSHRWKYTRYTRYGEELYDLEKDPAEIHNLADDANFKTVKQKLASQLNDWMSRTDDPFNTLRVTDRFGEQLDKQ